MMWPSSPPPDKVWKKLKSNLQLIAIFTIVVRILPYIIEQFHSDTPPTATTEEPKQT